jgi:hypothetical protein
VDQSLLPLSEAPWIKWVVVCNRPLRFYSFVGEVLETLHKEKVSGLANCLLLKLKAAEADPGGVGTVLHQQLCPAEIASSSVKPTVAIGGSVEMVRGMTR